MASRTNTPLIQGLAIAASAIPASLLAAYLGQSFVQGFDGLIVGLALLGGFCLTGMIITPALQGASMGSLPEYLAHRFGTAAGHLALMIGAAASLFLLSAEFVIAARLVETLTGIAREGATLLLAVLAALLVVAARTRAGPMLLALLALSIAAALCAILWLTAQGDLVPHLGYGKAVSDITGHEAAMLDGGLADFRSLKAHARAFLELDPLNTTAIAVALLAGAVLLIPASKQPHMTARASRVATAVAATVAMAVLISIPALATYAKREVYATITRGTPLNALPAWFEALSRADLVRIHGVSAKTLEDVARAVSSDPAADAAKVQAALSSDETSTGSAQAFADAKPKVKTALIEAAKASNLASMTSSFGTYQDAVLPEAATSQNNKTGLLTHGALEISPWGVPLLVAGLSGSPALTAALLAIAIALAAAATVRRLADGPMRVITRAPAVDIAAALVLVGLPALIAILSPKLDGVWLAVTGFSIAAAGLFPALVFGAWSRRISRFAAIAAMSAGAVTAASYSIATHVTPATAYALAPAFSTATDGTKKKFESLKATWEKAPDGSAKAAAWTTLNTYAAGNAQRPNMAEWWGISSAASAILALPLALLILLLDLPLRLFRR